MMNKISTEDIAKKAGDWAASFEGNQTIARILKEMETARQELDKRRKVPWRRMHEPMTI